jgi:hypothetical protein
MAINIKEWEEKYPDIDKELLMDWISDLVVKGVLLSEHEAEMKKKYDEYKGIEPSDTSDNFQEEDSENSQALKQEISNNEELSATSDTSDTFQEEYGDDEESEYAENYDEDDDYEDDEELANLESTDDQEPVDLKKEIEQEREEEESLEVPFQNPTLEDIEVPGDEEDDEPIEIEPEPKPRPKPRIPQKEMITKTISMQEYEEIMMPWRPFFNDIRDDPSTLVKLSNNIDPRRLPPYMQMKSYLLNHPIKEISNSTVQIEVISETNPRFTEPKQVNIAEAHEITKMMAGAWHVETAAQNFDKIIYKMMEERKSLTSLIYILELYAEMKQQSPFEFNIPKELLTKSINNSFETIKTLITQNVVAEMGLLRKDLQGEMVDVGSIVENNMVKFDTQIQEAVTKVMWKVKTDVENTNMEDIKRTILWILNKRSSSYNLGGAATAIITILLDDLERRLLETGFKLDSISEHRKYTVKELTYKLGYKGQSNVIKAISLLAQRKLVKIYQNKTISL